LGIRRQHSAKSGGEPEVDASTESLVVTGFNLSESPPAQTVQSLSPAMSPPNGQAHSFQGSRILVGTRGLGNGLFGKVADKAAREYARWKAKVLTA
jgi:hypothetical protein